MNCKNCGNPLVPEDKFCKLCGTPVQKNELGGMPNRNSNQANPQGPTPMSSPMQQQPMNPTPGRPNNPGMGPMQRPANNGPTGPNQGPVKPMNQPQRPTNMGNTQSMRPVGVPGNRPQGPAPTGNTQSMRPVSPAPAPVPGMPMNTAPQEAPEPEKKSILMPIIIVLLILGLAVGGYFGYKALSNKDDNGDGGNGGGTPVANNTKKVELGGYTFNIPSKFMVQADEDSLSLDDGTYGFVMVIIDYSYSQLSTDKVLSNFANEGLIGDYKGEQTSGDIKYHLFTVKKGTESIYVVYTSLGASKLLGLTIYNNPTTVLPTQANIDEAVKIGSSGEYTGTHNIETSGLEKISPKSFLIEEEASTGDVSKYTEDYSYADVTVDELY